MRISLDGQLFSCCEQFPGSINRGHQVTAWSWIVRRAVDVDLPADSLPCLNGGSLPPKTLATLPLPDLKDAPFASQHRQRASSGVSKTSLRLSHSLQGLWNSAKLFTHGYNLLYCKDEVKSSNVKRHAGQGPGKSFWLFSPSGVIWTALTSPPDDT